MRVAQLPDRLIYLGVIAVLVGLNLFLIWPSKPVPDDAPPPVDVSSRTDSASSSPEPTAQLPRATVPRVDPAGDLNRADWAVVFPGNDPPASLDEAMPFLLGRMGDLTPAQEARYNALHVVPWRPRSMTTIVRHPLAMSTTQRCGRNQSYWLMTIRGSTYCSRASRQPSRVV